MITIVCIMAGATLLVLPYNSHEDNQLAVALHAVEVLIVIIGLVHYKGGMEEDAANGLLFTLVACSFVLSSAAIYRDLSRRFSGGKNTDAEIQMQDIHKGGGIIRPSENPMRLW